MKKTLNAENGFTLLELIISMAIIAVIVGIALGGMKFGIFAREVGDHKSESYQRLRFIGEQISSKVRSFYPLFIQPTPIPPAGTAIGPTLTSATGAPAGVADPKAPPPIKLLAFEGLGDSMRFITYADSLSTARKNIGGHEVQFYLGQDPQTGESGIIMMEQDLVFDNAFITPPPENTQYILLAKDVSYLKFRYYKTRKLTPEELKTQKDPTILFVDEWVNEVPLDFGLPPVPFAGQIAQPNQPPLPDPQSKISSPRAVEISIGLIERPIPGNSVEPKLIYLPPMIIPLNAGVQMERPLPEVKK